LGSNVLHVLKVSSLANTLLIILGTCFKRLDFLNVVSKLSFHELRFFFKIFNFTLKLFDFGILFLFNSFDLRLMFDMFLIQKLRNVNL